MAGGREVALCCMFMISVASIIAGAVVLATAPTNEIPMWYSVTLCKGPESKATYYSYDVPSGQSCPAVLNLDSAAKTTQTFQVEKSLVDEKLKYNPVTMRTSGKVNIKFNIKDKNSKTVFTKSGTLSRRLLSTEEDTPEVADDMDYYDDVEQRDETAASRKLLKGSSGRGSRASSTSGGSRSRTRSGADSRYGSATSTRSTSYGTTSRNSVTSSTVVVVYRPGPRSSSSSSNYDQTEAHPSCTDKTKGCEYTVPSNLNRDEYTTNPIDPSKYTWPLQWSFTNTSFEPTSSTQQPELYGTLYTAETSEGYIVGAIVLSVGCFVCCMAACIGGAMMSDD